MYIYIGNLADKATLFDLGNLCGEFISKRARFEIVDSTDRHNRHGIVSIDSRILGQLLISKYNARLLKGSRLDIKEFFYRSCNNERRTLDWRQREWTLQEKRQHERRLRDRPHYSENRIMKVPVLAEGECQTKAVFV